MGRRERYFGITTALFVIAVISPLTASGHEAGPVLVRSEMPDWPQWRGPRCDGISDETGLLPAWPKDGPTRMWTIAGVSRGYSSPIAVGETIFITGDKKDDLMINSLSLSGNGVPPHTERLTIAGRSIRRRYSGARPAKLVGATPF
jgi:hypothetical protein